MRQISPAEWGSRVDYDSKDWTPWKPDKWVIHYGGGPVSNHNDGPAREMEVLRAWEWWHLKGQGWLGIAYNYAIGQSGTLYRLRGEQRSGATSGDADSDGIPENHEARAVVFILGGDQKPSDEALNTFSEFWATDPKPVIGHRDSTDTPCPGDHLYDWIQSKGYETMPKIPMPWWAKDAVKRLAARGYFTSGVPTEETKDMWRIYTFLDRADRSLMSRMEDWVRGHVKTSIAAALAAGAGSAQVDYGQLVQEIGKALAG